MEENKDKQENTRISTDAGKKVQHASIAQPQNIPGLSISPPQEQQPKKEIKIKKSTPEEFDKKSNIYVEPEEDEYPDEFEYSRTGTDQGIVIIFNQVKFLYDIESKRIGSTKDANDIIFTLGRLGYNIDEKYIYTNATSKEINEKIEEISKEDLKDRNSLILFYLSHGEEEDTIMTADGQVNTKHIWEKLASHKDLQNKPKLFIFQACKGDSLSTPFEKTQGAQQEHKISSISLAAYPLPPDILLCYSSVEGMKSYRDIERGSWLIQEICKNFLAYGRRDDVFTLLTRAAKCVSTYMFRNTKQMPVVVSTLSKKFYLSKSKDRTRNIAIHQIYKNICSILSELDSKIAALEGTPMSRK